MTWGCTDKSGAARPNAKGAKRQGNRKQVRVAIYAKPLTAAEKAALKSGPSAMFS